MSTMNVIQQPKNENKQDIQQKLTLTEEMKLFEECIKSSSAIMPMLSVAAITYGVCKISPLRAYAKYGALVGSVLGMISHKLIVANICLTKIASMPNSSFQEKLRQRYGNYGLMSERQYQGFQPLGMQSEVQKSDESSGILIDDYQPMNTFDTYSSLNDTSDLHTFENADLNEPINLQKCITYDELREKNRNEFYKKNTQWYTPKRPEGPPIAIQQSQQVPIDSSLPMQEKTKYGDVWNG